MPSVTVMVVNSRGVPPASATPFFAACAWRDSAMLQGAASFQVGGDADERLGDLLLGQAHRVVDRCGAARAPGPTVTCRLGRRDLSKAAMAIV